MGEGGGISFCLSDGRSPLEKGEVHGQGGKPWWLRSNATKAIRRKGAR